MANITTPYLSSNTYYGYITIGSLAILSNFAVLLILLINRNLFVNSAFVVGLAFGDILDGTALLGNGATRLYRVLYRLPNVNVHPFYCMRMFTAIFLMGNQIPGAMFALIGLERYLAVGRFDWYYANWTPKKAWLCFSGAYLMCAISLTVAFAITYRQPVDVEVSLTCSTPTVMGPAYMLFNYGLTIVGGVVAVTTTLIAMVMFTKRKMYSGNGHMLPYVKNQWRHTRSMFCIAVIDLGLVVVPNFLITLSNVFGVITITDLGPASLMTVSARSCFNIFIYLICNVEFRKAAFAVINLEKCVPRKKMRTAVKPKHDVAWINSLMVVEDKF